MLKNWLGRKNVPPSFQILSPFVTTKCTKRQAGMLYFFPQLIAALMSWRFFFLVDDFFILEVKWLFYPTRAVYIYAYSDGGLWSSRPLSHGILSKNFGIVCYRFTFVESSISVKNRYYMLRTRSCTSGPRVHQPILSVIASSNYDWTESRTAEC